MIITTTGTLNPVVITGLRGSNNNDLTLPHPTTSLNLLEYYTPEDLQGVANVLQALIDNGHINAFDVNNNPITQVDTEFDSSSLKDVAFTADYNDLINKPAIGVAVSDTDDVPEGSSNLYYTNARVATAPLVVANAAAVVNNTAAIVQNTNDIGVNEQAISENETDIADLQTQNTTQQTQINTNISDIAALQSNSGGGVFVEDQQTYALGQERTIAHTALSRIVLNAFNPDAVNISNFVEETGTAWDPLNRSSTENNLRDNNYTNLAYNDTAPNQPTGFILGIDLVTPKVITSFKLYDWTNATYIATSWQFIGSNNANASSYDVLYTRTGHTQSSNPNPFSQTISNATAYRYYGVRCLTPNNATYWVISELELFSGTASPPKDKLLTAGVDFDAFRESDTQTKIVNKIAAKDIKVIITGES